MAQVYAMDAAAASMVRESALRAIELDAQSADAWSALGFSRAMHEWDWAGAEAAFRRALEIAPDDAHALQWLASIRMIHRRFDEADRLLDRALAQEVRPGLYADRCQLEMYRGAYLDAIAECDRASQLDPAFPWAGEWRLRIALLTGDGPLAASLAGVADYGGMESLLDTLVARAARAPGRNASLIMAERLAVRGDRAGTLDALEQAVEARAFLAPFANADPAFDAVRHTPRFRHAMARMGL
jgi:tetratricopeptide (TPR) repeat protein